MRIVIPEYSGNFRIVSLALDEKVKNDLLSEVVEFLYVQSDRAVIYPDNTVITQSAEICRQFRECNNYDVFGISESGTAYRYYDDSSVENAFFITEKCNSNCVMCPSPDYSRQRGNGMEIDELIAIASHIPSDTSHITITGGEPFMAGKDIFRLLDYSKEKFRHTEFQILTNGRIFAVREYCELLKNTMPEHTVLGIPIHGSNSQIHDSITRAENSFDQTLIGVKRLLALGIDIEIRIVVCKNNLYDLSNIADLIATQLHETKYVSIMAMEMTGNAYKNRSLVWVPYRESFKYVEPAITRLMQAGIDVRLYNYPLCTVNKKYWTICAKSISSWKIRFSPICDGCTVKMDCGGVFAGTYKLECDELKAVQ